MAGKEEQLEPDGHEEEEQEDVELGEEDEEEEVVVEVEVGVEVGVLQGVNNKAGQLGKQLLPLYLLSLSPNKLVQK